MSDSERHADIRAGVAQLCKEYPGAYWREKDEHRDYPVEFVDALTAAGYLSVMIPEAYGGAGLPLGAACAILERWS